MLVDEQEHCARCGRELDTMSAFCSRCTKIVDEQIDDVMKRKQKYDDV